jgi:hypothetical protein
VYAQAVEAKASMVTDSAIEAPTALNPAVASVDKLSIYAYQATQSGETDTIGDPSSNANKVHYVYDEKDQGGGFVVPMNGAAIGLEGTMSSGNLHATIDQRINESNETLRQKNGNLRILVNIDRETRMAFVYRLHYIERDVLGAFNLRSGENTTYKGNLTGYKIGIFHQRQDFGIGAYNAPAMRGKAEVDGEQKILSESGTAGFDAFYNMAALRLALGIERFYYKRDDRRELSTSTDTQRRFSLNGLSLEQYFFATERSRVGVDFLLKRQAVIRTMVYQTKGEWLFEPERSPGGESRNRQEMKFNGGKISFLFDGVTARLELGLQKEARKRGIIRDSQGSFGFRTYGEYDSAVDTAFVDVTFLN